MLASRGNQTTKARKRSCDASAAEFVQYTLQIFSVPALPWQTKRRNERSDK